jgi:hypothetical protein
MTGAFEEEGHNTCCLTTRVRAVQLTLATGSYGSRVCDTAASVRFMIQGLGAGRSTQLVRPDLEAEGQGKAANEFVDADGGDGVVEFAGALLTGRNRASSVSAAWRAPSESLCSLRVSRWRIRCHSRTQVRNAISAFRRPFPIVLLFPHLFWRSHARQRTSPALGVGSSRRSSAVLDDHQQWSRQNNAKFLRESVPVEAGQFFDICW